MAKRIAILQSNYIPWKGYFDLIGLVDEFVILDTVQFTKNDWRNRNRIPGGKDGIWLSIPVKTSGRFGQRIDETEVDGAAWTRKHWMTIAQTYAKAPHFKAFEPLIGGLYEAAARQTSLSLINQLFIRALSETLEISTPITVADIIPVEDKTERVVQICTQRDATHYLTGPAARDYIEADQFERAGVTLEYMDYSGYPPYRQKSAAFDHYVSVIDLLFNEGPNARGFMKIGPPR